MTATDLAPSQMAGPSEPALEGITIGDALRAAAADAPEVTALVEGLSDGQRRAWTYDLLLRDAETVARSLLNLAEPGENVAIWANNIPEWILTQMGAALAGITLVTINPALRTEEALSVLQQSRAVGVMHIDAYRGFDVADRLAELKPGSPTSGGLFRSATGRASSSRPCRAPRCRRSLPRT